MRLAGAVFGLAAFLLASGCADHLPTSWEPIPAPPDTLSDNSFTLDGDGYRDAVFILASGSARAIWFADDTLTSVLTVGTARVGGRTAAVVVHISFPGNDAGSFEWANAALGETSKSYVRISVDGTEYVSVRGNTLAFILSDVAGLRIRGTYSGILQSAAGKQIILSDGRFSGTFF